eukprot:2084645-Amphidinium_carterae.1
MSNHSAVADPRIHLRRGLLPGITVRTTSSILNGLAGPGLPTVQSVTHCRLVFLSAARKEHLHPPRVEATKKKALQLIKTSPSAAQQVEAGQS